VPSVIPSSSAPRSGDGACASGPREDLGDPEVEELERRGPSLRLGQEDVPRLHVAVDDPGRVRAPERFESCFASSTASAGGSARRARSSS